MKHIPTRDRRHCIVEIGFERRLQSSWENVRKTSRNNQETFQTLVSEHCYWTKNDYLILCLPPWVLVCFSSSTHTLLPYLQKIGDMILASIWVLPVGGDSLVCGKQNVWGRFVFHIDWQKICLSALIKVACVVQETGPTYTSYMAEMSPRPAQPLEILTCTSHVTHIQSTSHTNFIYVPQVQYTSFRVIVSFHLPVWILGGSTAAVDK